MHKWICLSFAYLIAYTKANSDLKMKARTASMTLKLESLLQKKKQLGAQIQSTQSKITTQKRKDDTRRKILIGALILHEKNGSFETLLSKLDNFLTKDTDRSLFGLPSRGKTITTKEQ